jgi:hypothetical protein
MAYASALTGFKFNAALVPAVGTVSFSLQRAPLDITSIGSWNTHFIDGVASAAFTLDVFYSDADHDDLLFDLLNPTSTSPTRPVAFVIYFDGKATPVDYVSGNCIITGFDVVSQSGDVTRASFSAQVVGAINISGDVADKGIAEIPPT